MEMRHEHGSGDTLSGNIANHEIETAFASVNHVAVVAADDARRLVMIRDAPSAACQIVAGQESTLHLSGKLEIAFQRIALGPVEVIEAKTHKGIGDETVAFDGVMARLANSVCSRVDSCQSGVDFVEKGVESGRVDRLRGSLFQALLANQQLLNHEVVYNGRHFRELLAIRCSGILTGYGANPWHDTRFVRWMKHRRRNQHPD